jgi:hypothetical protein
MMGNIGLWLLIDITGGPKVGLQCIVYSIYYSVYLLLAHPVYLQTKVSKKTSILICSIFRALIRCVKCINRPTNARMMQLYVIG